MDRSDATDLMETAREALLHELLPALPGERRYVALMIANALAIAVREHRLGSDAARDEAARLRDLLAGIDPLQGDGIAVPRELRALRRAVGTAIRAGAFDGAERAALLSAALARTTEDRLAISNPKALQTEIVTPASDGTMQAHPA